MKKSVLVSVIIPTYNRVNFLLECIESIRSQSHTNLEIILVSDGGTDTSEKEILAIGDSRIFWHNLGVNFGRPAPARNYGLQLAKGDFICFCDDDDIWVKDKVESQLKSLTDSMDLTFSGFNVIGRTSRLSYSTKMSIISIYLNLSKGKAFNLLAILNPVCNSSVMVKASALQKFRFNDKEELRAVEDYVGWISLFSDLRVSYSKKPLVNYRVHDLNISNNSTKSLRALIGFVQSNKRDFPTLWRMFFILINRIRIALT